MVIRRIMVYLVMIVIVMVMGVVCSCLWLRLGVTLLHSFAVMTMFTVRVRLQSGLGYSQG